MKVVLHIGSNLGNRSLYLENACAEIRKEIGEIVSQSSIYQTEAWGVTDQPAFLNQALVVQSTSSPQFLLTQLKKIELRLGRKLREKWYQREIDIDIIFYDNEIVNSERLTIPHPLYKERNFVLIPLLEIIPEWIDPISKLTVNETHQLGIDNSSVEKWV